MLKRNFSFFDVINILIMVLLTIVMVYPFWYVVCYSFSDMSRVTGNELLLLPKGFRLDSYQVALSNDTILRGFFISAARTIIGPALMLIVSSLAAYVLSKDYLIGIKFLRRFFLFSMYISAGLLPSYMLVRSLGLTGSFWVYVIPGAANVFNIILIRAYIEGLPPELEESAKMDGASDFTVFTRVILPLCVPVIATVMLYACVSQWNSFMDAQLYNFRNPELYPVQYILYNFIAVKAPTKEAMATNHSLVTTAHSLRMGVTVLTTLPILCVYPFLQKHFASGLLVGAVKA